MMNINHFNLLGHIAGLHVISDDLTLINVLYSGKDGDVTIPVYFKCKLNLAIGSLIGVFGSIDADEHGLVLFASKLTVVQNEKASDR